MAYYQRHNTLPDIPEDCGRLLTPDSGHYPHSPHSPSSSISARRPSIETVYHTPGNPLEVRITERWKQPERKSMLPTPTQRYEKVAHQGLSDAHANLRKLYWRALFITLVFGFLHTVLGGVSISVVDEDTVLYGGTIWMTIWATITLLQVAVLIFLARPRRVMDRTTFLWHLNIHVFYAVVWLATAAAVISIVVRAKPDSYSKARRAASMVSQTSGKVADSMQNIGLVITTGAMGFIMCVSFAHNIYRVVKLLQQDVV